MADRLEKVDMAQATRIVRKLTHKFVIPSLNLVFNCGNCQELYGCFIPETNTECLNLDGEGLIFAYVPYHETGHALEQMYLGNAQISYLQGEAFARRMEELYLLTDGKFLEWRCSVCANDTFKLRPDGDVECLKCHTSYYPSLYMPAPHNSDSVS